MTHITLREEQLLLAVLQQGDQAYLVALKKHLSSVLGLHWTVGAIHKPLKHLEEAGLLSSKLGEATAKRGGRAKKIYAVTEKGMRALAERKRQHDALWASFQQTEWAR